MHRRNTVTGVAGAGSGTASQVTSGTSTPRSGDDPTLEPKPPRRPSMQLSQMHGAASTQPNLMAPRTPASPSKGRFSPLVLTGDSPSAANQSPISTACLELKHETHIGGLYGLGLNVSPEWPHVVLAATKLQDPEGRSINTSVTVGHHLVSVDGEGLEGNSQPIEGFILGELDTLAKLGFRNPETGQTYTVAARRHTVLRTWEQHNHHYEVKDDCKHKVFKTDGRIVSKLEGMRTLVNEGYHQAARTSQAMSREMVHSVERSILHLEDVLKKIKLPGSKAGDFHAPLKGVVDALVKAENHREGQEQEIIEIFASLEVEVDKTVTTVEQLLVVSEEQALKDRITEMEREIERLRQQLSKMTEGRDEYKAKCVVALGRVSNLESENEELKKELLKAKERIRVVEREHQETRDDLKAKVKALTITVETVTGERDSARKERDGLKEQVERLERGISQALKDRDDAKDRGDAALADRDRVAEERDDLRKKLSDSEEDKERLERKLEVTISERDDAEIKREMMMKERDEACRERDQAKRTLSTTQDELAVSLRQCQIAVKDCEDAQAKRDAVKSERDEVTHDRDSVRRALGLTEHENDLLKHQLGDMRKERDEAMIRRDALKKERDEVSHARDTLKRDLEISEEEREELNGKLSEALKERDDTVSKLSIARKERDEASSERDNVRRDLGVMTVDKERVEKQLVEEKRERQDATSKRDVFKRERDEVSHERDKLKKERDELSGEKDAVQRDHAAVSKERDSLQVQLTSTSTERDSARSERDAMKQERDQVMNEKESIERQLAGTKQEREETAIKRDTFKKEKEEAMREKGQIAKALDTSEQEIESLKMKLSETNSSLQDSITMRDAVKKERDSVVVERDSTKRSLEAAEQDKSSLARQLEEAQVGLKRASLEADKLKVQLASSVPSVQLTKSQAEATQQAEEASTFKAAAAELEQGVHQLEKQLRKSKEEEASLLARLAEMVPRSEVMEAQGRCDRAVAEAEGAVKQAGMLENNCKEIRGELRIAKSEAERLNALLKDMVPSTQLQTARNETKEAKEVAEATSATLSSTQNTIEELRARTVELQGQNHSLQSKVDSMFTQADMTKERRAAATAQEEREVVLTRMEGMVAKDRLTASLADLESERKAGVRLKEKIQELEGKLGAAAVALDKEKTLASDLETKMLGMVLRSELEAAKQSEKECDEAWQERYDRLKQEFAEHNSRLEAMQQGGRDAEGALAKAEMELNALKERLRAAEERERQGLEREKEMARSRADAIREVQQKEGEKLRVAREEWAEATSKLKEEMSREKALHSASVVKTEEEHKAEIRKLKAEMLEMEKRHAEIVESMQAKHRQEMEERLQMLNDMGLQVSEASGLKGENEALTAWLVKKETALKEALEDVEKLRNQLKLVVAEAVGDFTDHTQLQDKIKELQDKLEVSQEDLVSTKRALDDANRKLGIPSSSKTTDHDNLLGFITGVLTPRGGPTGSPEKKAWA